MACESPQESSSGQSELRIVLLGSSEDGQNKVVESLLNFENLKGEKVGLCTIYKCEQAGRRISVVTTPGWDRQSMETSSENIRKELVRSVSLCPPGPHVLLLVIPVKALCDKPSADELDWTLRLKEFLSERVWKHTIVLFDCDEGVEEAVINEHIHSAERILDKCGGRSFVLQKTNTWINELFNNIDRLVEENHGDVFIPQVYYELIQQKTKESSGETELRLRRGSLDTPPSLNEGDSEEKKETKESNHMLSEEGIKFIMDNKHFVVILMGMFALLGSVTGAQNGVLGAFTGIVVGIIIRVVLASFIMYIYTYFYLPTYAKQSTHSTTATK